jgi:hydrogenase-4 component B
MILTFAGMSIIGGISILTFTKTFGIVFLGTPRQQLKHEPVEVSFLMLLPQFIIVAVMTIIAFFPGFFIRIVITILSNSSFPDLNLNTTDLQVYLEVMKKISLSSLLFFAVTGIVFLIRYILTRGTEVKNSSTWGCGYLAPDPGMQYTGKSFSKSFGKLLNFMLTEKKEYIEIERNETFPATRKHSSHYIDFIESRLIEPVILLLKRFINMFQFIQNGKIQAYVIYGIVFILAIFIGTVLNLW